MIKKIDNSNDSFDLLIVIPINSLLMDLFQIVPLDVIIVLLDTLYKSCLTSFIIMSYVSPLFHSYTSSYANKNFLTERRLNCEEIASKGYLRVYQWTRSPRHQINYIRESHKLCAMQAASNGHLELLQWIARTTRRIPEDDIRRCADICTFAAKYRQYKIVSWAHKNGFSWTSGVCVYAARDGYLWLLIKAYQNGSFWNPGISYKAAKHGHLEILRWIKKIGNLSRTDLNVCANAAKGGYLRVLKWLRQNDCEWDYTTCAYAAKNNHLEIIQWARSEECEWDEYTCECAAENGYLEVLKWCREQGCPWDKATCSAAAYGGHLEVLKWVRNPAMVPRGKVCEWDEETCNNAAYKGHLDVLQWAYENGCTLTQYAWSVTIEKGHLNVLQWIHQTCSSIHKYDICGEAVRYNQLGILQWALQNGYTMEAAVECEASLLWPQLFPIDLD